LLIVHEIAASTIDQRNLLYGETSWGNQNGCMAGCGRSAMMEIKVSQGGIVRQQREQTMPQQRISE
jgi:hypothetical protein